MNDSIEIIIPRPETALPFGHAVLDFDGTLSLIREGWQKIMIPYFAEALFNTPKGPDKGYDALERLAREFIFLHTGKQTIYQCIALCEEIKKLAGEPLDPQAYKDEYHRRLLEQIDFRLKGLEKGDIDPETLTVPGSRELLTMLREQGVELYLASGTDEEYVMKEVRLLKLDGFFNGHIYGAQREYKTFSKKMVIERILRENNLRGESLLGFGDGYVEIENIKEVDGFAVGVASNEATRKGLDEWKRERLIRAGANIIIPDYRELNALKACLFPG